MGHLRSTCTAPPSVADFGAVADPPRVELAQRAGRAAHGVALGCHGLHRGHGVGLHSLHSRASDWSRGPYRRSSIGAVDHTLY